MMQIISIYCTAFYGSNLWDLNSKDVVKIFSSWNVMVRNVFSLPRNAHRYLIETTSSSRHPKVMMCSRFLKFIDTVLSSQKRSVRYLALLVKNDRRTLVGRTISAIANDCKVDRNFLSYTTVRSLKYWSPPEYETWRCPLLTELLRVRDGATFVPGFKEDEIRILIDDVCSS